MNIKPCPFCGSTDVSVKNVVRRPTWYVECGGCEVEGPASYDSPENATHQWNTRHEVAQPSLSLRDYFAGQMLPRISTGWPNLENRKMMARQAYEMADAMLDERAA